MDRRSRFNPILSRDVSIHAEINRRSPQQPVIPWEWHGYDRVDSMEPSIYRAVLSGNTDSVKAALNRHPDLVNFLDQVVTSRGDTVLHIAARLNNSQLLEYLLDNFPALYLRVNTKEDHPLHVAAAAGHLSAVRCLIRDRAGEQITTKRFLKSGNVKGNTPLHMALQNRNYEVAKLLFTAAPEVSYSLNSDNVYPLYMAAEAGNMELVESMMQYIVSSPDYRKQDGAEIVLMKSVLSLVHVAIRNRNMGVLEIAFSYEPSLFQRYDEKSRTPLSTAASMGYLDGVRFIVERFAQHPYHRDPLGWNSPVHMAARKGHVEVIQELLRRFPDLRELLNGSGQNILHMAAESGRANVVKYILQVPLLEMLINETDEAGHTPLHLATIVAHPKVVSILTWDKRVRLDLKDNKGHTVMDAALMSSNVESPSFQQRLTLLALKYANAPRSKDPIPITQTQSLETYKDRITSFMLVATLIMIVTYVAGLSVPGGFNASYSYYKGMAVLVQKAAFQAFVITNTTALYSSMVVVIALVWAQVGDLYLIQTFLKYAIPLLGLSLAMLCLSFMLGVSVVVSNLSWLPAIVLVVGSISLFAGLTLLLLLCLPSSLDHQTLRSILYYPFCLLIFISELNAKDDIDRDVVVDLDDIESNHRRDPNL